MQKAKELNYGVGEILQEREKQINKHGYDAESQAMNPEYYEAGQLISGAYELLKIDFDGYPREDIPFGVREPLNWNKEQFIKLALKSKKDRIRIAAALLAAELDRLHYLENL